ncbi:hypothetical protein J2Z75_001652 [Rhizobium herbae]|uniref:Uncharacterized protein n=1 Tax=Rhizobium herbae TaxID=508661 RepID=A0ABS4EJY9_9HYPH|nr:hypothetical protein [Rhizobium herbae]
MIDAILIDDLLVAEMQIEEIVFHADAPDPCVAGDFPGLRTQCRE